MIILGGGISGLSFAYHYGKPCEIIEREVLGGLCASYEVEGYMLDRGVHTFFTKSQYVKDFYNNIMDGTILWRDSVAKIWLDGRYINYPIQKHAGELPGKIGIDHTRPEYIADFRDFLLNKFGYDLCRMFFFPYNEKKFQIDLSEMDYTWADYKNGTDEIHNAQMGYPKNGGFGTLIEKLSEKIKANVIIKDAINIPGDRPLVSTIPLTRLCGKYDCENLLPSDMECHPTYIYSIGIMGTPKTIFDWAYYPQEKIPFYRVSQPSNFNGTVAPQGEYLIQCESSSPERKENILNALGHVDIIKPEVSTNRLVFYNEMTLPYAYVIPKTGQEKRIAQTIGYLNDLGIYPLGRFGEWEYLDADQCILRAKELAERLKNEY